MLEVGSEIWIYIFIAMLAIVLIYYIKNFTKLKIEIRKRNRSGLPLQAIGYLEMDNDGSAGEVRLPGCGSLPSVGRVIVDKQAGRECGFVEVVSTDIEDESVTPRYKQAGYLCFNGDNIIDKFGYVYRQEKGSKERVVIGYCARPSDPNTPTIYGERNWRTLWLKCTLNFYAGLPKIEKTEGETEQKKSVEANCNITNNVAKLVGINDDKQAAADEQLVEEPYFEPIADDEPSQPTDAAVAEEPVLEPAVTEEPKSEPKAVEAVEEQPVEEQPVEETPEEKSEEKAVEKSEEAEDKKADKKKKKAKKKKITKEPMASASFIGFHSSLKDYLPAEARACAFAALAGDLRQGQYSEYYKAQPYGWKDTALLSSLIYSALFLVLYFGHRIVGKTLVGENFEDIFVIFILIGMYYLLWMLVRLVKIDCIENSNSFQKTLDLLNKNVGLKGFNITILILSLFAFYFSLMSANIDLIPLIWAIAWGVFTNMLLKGANTSWIISTSYNEKDSNRDSKEEVENPIGDISRTYEWELDATYSSQQLSGSLTLYFTAQDMADMRQCNPFFAQRKDKSDKDYILDMFGFLKEHRSFMARVRYIAKYIDEAITEHSLTPFDKIQFTLDFVQEPNIRFVENQDCKSVNNYEDYIRYPDETLYDKEGDCNSKSLLAAMLFHEMGYNVMYLASRKFKHSAIGIEFTQKEVDEMSYGSKGDEMFIREGGKFYLYCETTGDRYKIGKPIDGMSVNDFEEKVLLNVESELPTEEKSQEKSVIYNWDLSSATEAQLHGNLVLKFNYDDVDMLRTCNPFRTYGYDTNTYDANVSSMFKYLCESESNTRNVQTVANYIKRKIDGAKLSDLDMVQFVLNFVQMPNIAYQIDEECMSIGYQKEYMRFPDETLCDKEGDCDCKSFLAANILHCLGYNVLFLLSNKLKHAAIAVECKNEWFDVIASSNIDDIKLEHNGRHYVFCECTGENNVVGFIKEGDSIKDFETIVELPA